MISVCKVEKEDISEVSSFLSKLNKDSTSHIGYCGQDEKEIEEALREYIEEEAESSPFFIARYKNKLVGVIGIDGDLESGNGELWGPFIENVEERQWEYIATMLWNSLFQEAHESIQNYHMFINVKNKRCISFAEENNFTFSEKDNLFKTLKLTKKDFNYDCDESIIEINDTFNKEMVSLHNNTFNKAYYSGERIIKRLNQFRKVFAAIKEEKLLGYIYVEADPEFSEASIEFFAVDEIYRGQGIGFKLINKAINWIFTFPEIKEINLCVNSKNSAINLYKAVGFKEINELAFYRKNRIN